MVDISKLHNSYVRNCIEDVAADKKYRHMTNGDGLTDKHKSDFHRKPYDLGDVKACIPKSHIKEIV